MDFETGTVDLVRLSEADYARASFLDERILSGEPERLAAKWTDAATAATALPPAVDFIFHMGHVGSTLLARVLGSDPGIFALREPALLRALVRDHAATDRLDTVVRLLARTWRADQRSLVKATSFVSDLGPELLRLAPSARAILLISGPQVLAASLLAGEATRAELSAAAPARLARLGRKLTRPLAPPVSPGELAMLAWACELRALADIALAAPDRVMWLDFDGLLSDPRAGLDLALRWLRPSATPDEVDRLVASDAWRRHAKAPDHNFDADDRRQVLGQALNDHTEEIAMGMKWLDAAGAEHPELAAASQLAARSRRP